MRRRLAVQLLVVLFSFWCVVSPARAFVVVAPFVLTGSGTAIQVAAGSVASLLGSMVVAFTIANDSGDEIRLPLGDDAATAIAMPAPAAQGTTDGQISTIYSVYDSFHEACSTTGHSSAAAACGAWASCKGQYVSPDANFSGGGVVGSNCSYTMSGQTYSDMPVSGSGTALTCPVGYAVSGSSCILQNARQAISDDKCDLQFSGTGAGSKYMYYDDVDCPSGPTVDNGAFVPGLRNDGKTGFISGTDSSGRPILVEFQVSDDGTKTYVRHYTQDTQGGNSVVQETSLTIDRATSRVTNTSTVTNPGTISQPGTSTIPTTTTTAPTAADTPTVQRDPEKVQSIETCGLPGKPACVIDDSGFNIQAPTLNVPDADLDAQKNAINAIADPGFGVSLLPALTPGSATACQPLQFRGAVASQGLDHTETLDLCWMFDIGRAVLGYLFWAGGVLYVWRRFTGSNAGVA